MKKIILITSALVLILTLFSCGRDYEQELKLIYRISSIEEMDSSIISDEIEKVKTSIYIRINLRDDYNNEEIKNLVNEDMSSEEIDKLIRASREKSSIYYKLLNENFVNKNNLSTFSNGLYVSKYSPTITLYFKTKDNVLYIFEELVKRLDFSDVLSIELLENR